MSDYYFEEVNTNISLTLGNNEIYEYHTNTTWNIKVEEIHTVYRGLCYKVAPYIWHSTIKQKYGFEFEFGKNLDKKDLPKQVEIIATSGDNALGAITSTWKEGVETSKDLNLNHGYILSLRSRVTAYLSEFSGSFYKCLGDMFHQVLVNQTLCLPIQAKDLIRKFDFEIFFQIRKTLFHLQAWLIFPTTTQNVILQKTTGIHS